MKKHLLTKILSLVLLFTGLNVASKAQSAINLYGGGNQATAPFSFDLANGFTLEYEIYFDDLKDYNGGVTATNGNIADPIDMYVDHTGQLSVFMGDGNNYGQTNTTGIVAGQWYNIAICYDQPKGLGYLYINGVLKGTMSANNIGNIGLITLGNRADTATNGDVQLSNVQIWSGLRSVSQIVTDEYTCYTGTEPGLKVLYTMTEGTGTTLHNLGAFSSTCDATITGAFTWTHGADTAYITDTAVGRYFSPSGNNVWTKSGTYIDQLSGAGCYKVAKINLTMNHIIYVNQSAAGAGTGADWADAFTDFGVAVDSAVAGDTIWVAAVAAGAYQPASGKSYTMKDSVAIYGGFAGTETSLSQRSVSANVTTLQGNGASVISNTGNNLTNAAVLDGFTITGGGGSSGAGMHNDVGLGSTGSSPTLSNLIISNNNSTGNAGGMYNNYSSPVIINVVFSNNSCVNIGGGMLNDNNSSPVLTNVVFSGNSCSSNSGGGICNEDNSSPVITNATFSNNSVGNVGGAIADINGSLPVITNSVFWGNSAANAGADIIDDVPGASVVTYCYTQTSISGTGNVQGTVDPFKGDANLAAAQGADGIWATTDDGLHLDKTNPIGGALAIGTGSNAAIPVGVSTDITGVVARIQGTTIDMGAYANGLNTISFINKTVCDSFNYTSISNTAYTVKASGIVIDTIQNLEMQDSVMNITLTVHHSSGSSVSTGIYSGNGYYFNGNNYSTSGHYTYSTSNATGCDSTANLYLTQYAVPNVSSSGICPGSVLTLTNVNPTPYVIQWIDNNNVVTADTANWKGKGTVVAYTGLINAWGSTMDSHGNLYVTNNTNIEMFPAGSNANTLGTVVAQVGISNAGGVASVRVDTAGNIFVLDFNNGVVLKYPPGSTLSTVPARVGSGLSYPQNFFVDNADNIYVTNSNSGTVVYFAPGDTNGTVIAAQGLTYPESVYLDANSNLYVSNSIDGVTDNVIKFPAGSNASTVGTVVAQNISYPWGLTVDGNNNLFVTSYGSSYVLAFLNGSTIAEDTIGNGVLSSPYDMFTDASGNIYVANYGASNVIEFTNNILLTDTAKQAGSWSASVTSFTGNNTSTSFYTIATPAASAINIGTYASSYMFKGTNETKSGHYVFDTVDVVGCDSTINLYLTLYAQPTITTSGTCAPVDLTLNGVPTPVWAQWKQNGNVVAVDTAKWDTGSYFAGLNRTKFSGLPIAVDTAGNTYVGYRFKVYKYRKGATDTTKGLLVATNNLSTVQDIKVDMAGNLFVLDADNDQVYEFASPYDSTTTPVVVASNGINSPTYMFVDNADNIYEADDNNVVVNYYPAGSNSNTSPIVLASTGLSDVAGLTVDNSGNLFVADYNSLDVVEYPKASSASNSGTIVAASELGSADNLEAITVDGNGYLYVEAEFRNNRLHEDTSVIYVYAPGSTLTSAPIDTILLPGMIESYWFAMDANGNIYATSKNNNMWYAKKFTIKPMKYIAVAAGTYTADVSAFTMSTTTTAGVKIGIATTSNTNAKACDTYTSPSGKYVWTSTSTYKDTIKNKSGCDSVMTINLTINHSNTGDTTAAACGSFKWHGNTYSTSTSTPTFTEINKAGCDSVVTLHLTINNPVTGDTTVVACGSFKWYGNTYTLNGNPTQLFSSHLTGCDSTVTLHLTVNNADTSITQSGAQLTANATSATYQWLTCGTPDVAIGGATSAAYTVTSDGNYAVVVTQNGCVDTSDCRNMLITGMKNITSGDNLDVYPMPNNGHFTISFNGVTYQTITIYDEAGKEIVKQTINQNSNNLQLDLSMYADGVYYAKLVSTNGVVNKKIVIQK